MLSVTHPVENVPLWTPRLLLDLIEAELQAEAAVAPDPVLRGTEDGDGAGEGEGGGRSSLLYSHGFRRHSETSEEGIAPPLLCPSSNDVVLGLGLAVDLKWRFVQITSLSQDISPSGPSSSAPQSGPQPPGPWH